MKGFSTRSLLFALSAAAVMFAFYFGLITLLSSASYAQEQFSLYWPYVTALAIGFGVQIGLYTSLREHRCQEGAGVVVASGTSGAVGMAACCAHHLADLVPVLGLSGVATVVSSYQLQLFWIGLAFNLTGIIFLFHETQKVWRTS